MQHNYFRAMGVITTLGQFNMIPDKVEFLFSSLAGVAFSRRISPVFH